MPVLPVLGYRRSCVDHDGLRNPVELWLAGGGRYHPKTRRKISSPDEVLPRWRAGIEAAGLNPVHRDLPPKPWKRRRRSKAADLATDLATVPEVAVEASAGPGAWNEDFVHEKARWRIPEAMIRHEGDADPAALRILRVRGVSMEPELRGGDRLLVDTARRVPAAGELFVLWDGDGLVVKRVEPDRGPGAAKLRLLSANPDYPPYTRRAEDIHIVGRVVWKLVRM